MYITRLETGSVLYGKLPKGCELCQRGLKSVIFVTGLCPASCFYCPISLDRRKDVTFINERKISNIKEILVEVIRSASLGVSLTGGDPLARPDKTLRIINLLKNYFGAKFHIHLYTSGINLSLRILKKLENAGLDEIRIHPTTEYVFKKLPVLVKDTSINLGIEIPMLPGTVNKTFNNIKFFEKIGVKFVNLNELEFSETNAVALLERGYTMNENYISVRNSKEDAIDVIKLAAKEQLEISIHFCPIEVKDRYQTSLRLFRRANVVSSIFHKITDEGTIIMVEVKSSKDLLRHIPTGLIIKKSKNTYITSIDYIDYIKKIDNKAEFFILEKLASHDKLLVEKIKID